MAKDPKKLNPENPYSKTYPGQDLNTGVSPKTTDLLPTIFRTETNKKVLSAVMEDLFQPSSIETLNYAVGRNRTKFTGLDYLPHPTARRQLETGLVLFKDTGASVLTADDIATAWDLNDRTRETAEPISILDLPIDPDKFLNWANYYWIEERMPVVFLTSGNTDLNVQSDIVGKKYYTSPVQPNGRSLEFKNGMRVVFHQRPGLTDISGNLDLDLVTDGTDQLHLDYEFVNYNRGLIGVSVDGVILTQGVDYYITGNHIVWLTEVPALKAVHVHAPNFYITLDEELRLRSWLVTGVGTEEGIQLLGLSSQFTNTVYSKLSNALWDQSAVPWDRVEWDGFIPGINPKEYILQEPGAKNRNAHSRTNCWFHKSTIQTAVDFLGIEFSDIAKSDSQAMRPIVEFENSLELYNHGTRYRAWPTFLVNELNISVPDFINLPLVDKNTTALNSRYMALLAKLDRQVDIIVQTQIGANFKLALNASSIPQDELIKILANLDRDNAANRIPKYAVYKITGNTITWIKNPPAANWTITYRISGVLLSALRMLWLTKDSNVNTILNIKHDGVVTTGVSKEMANDGDAVVINVTSPADPHYLKEYHWKNGVAVPATFRTTAIQQPVFEIYSRDGVKLSSNTRTKPSVVNSTIVKIKSGSHYDAESGYSLDFLPTQFTQLTDTNIAANSMYNILFEHTLQTTALYIDGTGTQQPVLGPYSFRRFANGTTNDELSSGYRRAWFRLKSWALRSQSINGPTTIQLDSSMWPEYNWAVKIANGVGTVLHTDNFKPVVDGVAVAARGRTVSFKVYHNGLQTVATVRGQGFEAFDVPVVDGTVSFVVPATAIDTLTVSVGFISFTARLIELKDDPRFVKIKLNGLPVEYTIDSTAYTISLNGTGVVELQHQGNNIVGDHLTAIPGIDHNPEQFETLGELSVARIIKGLSKNIAINTAGKREWIDSPKFKTLDGIYMADNSAMRSSWANFALQPGLQDVVVARSMSAWRWYRKFITKLEESNITFDISTYGVSNATDRILSEMLLGVNYSSVDAISGMAFVRDGMQLNTVTANGGNTFAIGSSTLFKLPYAADHVYVYVNDNLQLRGVDYTISGQQVVFNTVPALDSVIEIYFAEQTEVYSGIPASPAKLGLGGLYIPGLVSETWGNNSKTFIQRHDGSRISAYINPESGEVSADDPLNTIILELEKRIYNACINTVGEANRQYAFRNYDNQQITESQARSQLEWYSINGIDYRSRSDFDANDAWTWNYGGASWRKLYLDFYGTYRLHDAPWEALGYNIKPNWWDTHYSWTDATKRTALELALYFGILNEPGAAAYTDPNFAHPHATYPVDAYGNLLSPFDAGIASPTVDEAQQPWEIGSMGPAETAWRRSITGTWSNVLHAIDRYDLVNEFFDSSINPFIQTVHNNSTAPKGTGSIAPDQFLYTRPLMGIGAVLFEGYREFNLLGESPLEDLLAISTKLEFSVGGFTDGVITLKMPYSKFQDNEYVPDNDFGLTLSRGVPKEQLRYTSVRVEKDDVGFRVYGFDPKHRFFKVLTPTANALSNSYPTTRRQLATNYGIFTEYLSWNTTPVMVPYGSYVANKQDLITLLMGLGEYQQQQGLILDSINSRGTITDWKQVAIDAIAWSEEQWGEEHFCVVGVATSDGLKIQHSMGALSRLDADLGRTGKILYANGSSASSAELLITRDFEPGIDKITPLTENQIVFVNFETQLYDHVFFISNKTKFGDLIADLQTDNRLQDLTISGRRTYNWTGRPSAHGILPQQYSSLPGFDTLVNDIVASHMPERVAFDTIKTDIARSNVVPSKKSVIADVVQDSSSAYLYRQGLQSAVGTNLAINALFRNRNIDIPGNEQDVGVNEQWMFSTGEFGNLSNKKIWEIELRKKDLTSNRQIVRFRDDALGVSDIRSDNIIDIVGKADPRWVSRPSDYLFKTINRDAIDKNFSKSQNWLPSAGLADVVETDIEIMRLSDLTFDKLVNVERSELLFKTPSFSRYVDYNPGDYVWHQGELYSAEFRIVGSAVSAFNADHWNKVPVTGTMLPSIWISDYIFTAPQGYGWNVLQAFAPAYIEEICPNAINTGLNESKASFASPHRLTKGDSFIISGTNDGNYDGVHQVKEVVDDYNVLIQARSTSNEVVYNAVGFKLSSVKFTTDEEFLASTLSFSAGMTAYVDYGDIEGSYKIYTFTGNGQASSQQYNTENYSNTMIDSGSIYQVQLFDYNTENLIQTLEVFDPYKGLTIDDVAQYIDFKQLPDPASYNVSELGVIDGYNSSPWGAEQVGKLWWDLDKVRYIEYEQSGNLQYRANHWGERFADSEVAIYEWVASYELPTPDIAPNAYLDTSGNAEGQIRYSEVVTTDPESGAVLTTYYYWMRAPLVVPAGGSRTYSAAAIESVLNNPDANGVAWLAPIDTNAFIISNISGLFGNRDKIVLRIEQNLNPEQVHSNSVLVTENVDVIDDFLYQRLSSSIVGRDNYREAYKLNEYTVGTKYFKGDYLYIKNNGVDITTSTYSGSDYPILQNLDDTRYDINTVRRATSADHKIYVAINDFVASSLARDIKKRVIIKSAAGALIKDPYENTEGYYAVVNTRRKVPDTSLHPLRRYGNAYAPRPQSWFKDVIAARRTLITAANDYLLNIDTVSKPDWDRYLIKYQPLNGSYEKDLTQYWYYTDYIVSGYTVGNEQVQIRSENIGSLDSTVTNFGIVDAYGNIIEAYTKSGNNLTLMYRKNGTIQFSNAIWDGSLNDAWDKLPWDRTYWDEDISEVVESILRALRKNIFVGEDINYFNKLFFALVKESLSQISNADWIVKTTYLDVFQTSERELEKVGTYYNKKDKLIIKYIDEVKPFHSKIVEANKLNNAQQDIAVSIGESITLTWTTISALTDEDGNIIKTEDGRNLAPIADVTVQDLQEE
jgi:hypothetical protein